MPVFMMVAVKTLHTAALVAAKGNTVVGIVHSHGRTSRAVAAQLDAIAIARERGRAIQVFLHPGMILGLATLPCPTLCHHHAIVGFKQVPGIVAVAPCPASDKAVALAIVHLAGKTIGIRTVVHVKVAVVVRVAIHNIVVGTV